MARKFLYVVALLIVVVVAALFALRLFSDRLSELAFVPTGAFEEQAPLERNAYANRDLWFSHPDLSAGNDPSRWAPEGVAPPPDAGTDFAVFFVHPTSYLDRGNWNGPLDDERSQALARTFLRGMASAFAAADEIWAPRYRQATFGAFLTDAPEAQRAIDLAHRDVELAFEHFLASVGPGTPIVLAGHSQGALHVLRLLRDRVAGTPLQQRVAMAYPIGWPISVAHDLGALGLPACTAAGEAGCLVSWSSFAEPADPGDWLGVYRQSAGFDGALRGDSAILCVNPLTGAQDGSAPAEANLGTLVPNAQLSDAELVPAAVPARCDERGLLLIGDPPAMGPAVLPGENYHVYDIPLFWANLRQDVARRMQAWASR